MGYLHYGPHHIYRFDDRTLAHLRSVITSKLLLKENFVFTWVDGGLQTTLWLQPSVVLVFEFESPTTPELNRAWLEALKAEANSPSGLTLLPEPTILESS